MDTLARRHRGWSWMLRGTNARKWCAQNQGTIEISGALDCFELGT
jgi:hypothetical protein